MPTYLITNAGSPSTVAFDYTTEGVLNKRAAVRPGETLRVVGVLGLPEIKRLSSLGIGVVVQSPTDPLLVRERQQSAAIAQLEQRIGEGSPADEAAVASLSTRIDAEVSARILADASQQAHTHPTFTAEAPGFVPAADPGVTSMPSNVPQATPALRPDGWGPVASQAALVLLYGTVDGLLSADTSLSQAIGAEVSARFEALASKVSPDLSEVQAAGSSVQAQARANLGLQATSKHLFTATAGQTTFSVTYSPGSIDVYRNGVLQVSGDDYTATDGTSVVFASGCAVNDVVVVSVSSAIAASFPSSLIVDSTPLGRRTVTGGVRVLGDADATLLASETVVVLTTPLTARRTAILPAASALPAGGSMVLTVDPAAVSGMFWLSVQRAGSDTLNGSSAAAQIKRGGVITLTSNGSNAWSTDLGKYEFQVEPWRRPAITFFEDFISGPNGALSALSSGGSNSAEPSYGNTVGVAAFATGTSSTGYSGVRSGSGTRTLQYATGEVQFIIRTRIETLSTMAEEYNVFFGLSNGGQASVLPQDGVWFLYDRLNRGTNWFGVTAVGGSRTFVDLGVAATAPGDVSEFVTLSFVVNAVSTRVEFFVNGNYAGASTSNLPTSSSEPALNLFINKTAGTTSRRFFVDYVGFSKLPTTSRVV